MLWIGKEGRVYGVLDFASDLRECDSVCEAEQKEGTTGFLYFEGGYHAVTFHDDYWVPATMGEMEAFTEGQEREWSFVGAEMPFKFRAVYFYHWWKANQHYHAQFVNPY